MYIFYEEDGLFKVGTILSESPTNYQVETPNGKRIKLKQQNALLTFKDTSPTALLQAAEEAAANIDIPFAWECAPQEEFTIANFAADYFGHTPSALETATLTIAIHSAPVYFHRKGKGLYKPAPPEILEAALAAIEKKKQQTALMEQWTEQLVAGAVPAELEKTIPSFLHKPDKNSLEWKAFDQACQQLSMSPSRLLWHIKVLKNLYALHKAPFMAEHFPKGTEFANIEIPSIDCQWNITEIEAYSIDDASTTEIDDALSVQPLGENKYLIGVHIAAPALLVTRDTPLDKSARQRLSTIYLPGEKFPMQPAIISELFSLDAGKLCPCISLYITFNATDSTIEAIETKLERITVRENLRLHNLEPHLSPDVLNDPQSSFPYSDLLKPLWQFALFRTTVRDGVRGYPEQQQRHEFSFQIEGDPNDLQPPKVTLIPRERGNPLDRITSECMIMANETWSGLLKESGVTGIFRSQQAGRVRVSTHADPHDTIGVPHYGWFTSPLRRYIDLINQGQLIAAVEHGISARLVAPFKAKEAELFAVIGQFEAAHLAYQKFQRHIENYWTLCWIEQQKFQPPIIEATCFKEHLVRLVDAPFVTKIPQLPSSAIGHLVQIEIQAIDLIECTLSARFVKVIEDAPAICIEEDEFLTPSIVPITSPPETSDAHDSVS